MVLEGLVEPLLSLGILVLVVFVALRVIKNVLVLVVNSILGLALLFVAKSFFGVSVSLNVWSILVTILGGILGAILVIALHLAGIAF